MTGHRRRIPWVVAIAAAVLVPAAPAAAHEHPTPTERSAPGVVWVEARAQVEVSLVEHLLSDPGGVHIRIVQSTWSPLLGSASGFVVSPNGAVVTSGSIHEPTAADLERASIYAVNEAFREHYGRQAPLSAESFTRQRIGGDGSRLQQRLEACYPPHRVNDAGGCVVRVTPTYLIYPHVTDQAKYGRLPAELVDASTSDVAVLQIRAANGMPTVALGQSTEGAQALANLGFTGVPGEGQELQAINAHLAEAGGTVLKTENLDEKETKANTDLAAALPQGLRGGPVVAEGGQVVGLLEPEADSGPPPASPGRLIEVGAIREVLSAARISPRQGPVDTSFEAAMHAFKNGGYAAAIPNFKATLGLFPGHAMARTNLAEAEKNVAAGTPGPAPGTSAGSSSAGTSTGTSWTVVLVVVAALLVVAAVVAFLLLRRRRAGPGGAPGSSPVPPRPRTGQAVAPRPRDAVPAGPSRPAAAKGERQAAPGRAPVARAEAEPVMADGGPAPGAAAPGREKPGRPGSASSKQLPRHASAAAVAGGGQRLSRASATAQPVTTAGRHTPLAPGAEDRPVFCTACGAALAPHHRFCGRCGAATG
jgi:hypothetical protein